MTTQIVITDCDFGRGEIEADVLGSNYRVTVENVSTPDEIEQVAQEAQGLFVQWAKVDADVLRRLPNLRAIVRYGIGLDNIDLQAARDRGVAVTNVDDYCIEEVASHAAAGIAAASRRLWQFDRAVRRGEWAPGAVAPPLPADEDPVGIAGMGRIGQSVARMVRAWGHPVIYWDPFTSVPEYERCETLTELASRVNHLSLHTPLTPATTRMVDRDVVVALGQHGHLVNTSRGGLVDEQALLDALDSGKLGWASLDVLANEPPFADATSARLARHDSTIITPHMAYLSTRALSTLRRSAATRMAKLLS